MSSEVRLWRAKDEFVFNSTSTASTHQYLQWRLSCYSDLSSPLM